jgi:hypothetical protein
LILVFILRRSIEKAEDENCPDSEVASYKLDDVTENREAAVAFEPSLFTTLLVHH